MSTDTKIIGSIGILTLVILVGGVWLLSAQSGKEQAKLDKPLLGEGVAIQNTTHIKPGETHAAYNSNPPTGGWMYDDVAGGGIHDSEVPDEKLVHSMEHGAVIVWYKPKDTFSQEQPTNGTESARVAGLASEEIEKLKQIFNSVDGRKILVPRKNLDVPVVLTSWGRLLKLQSIDENQIKAFIATNENRGPEKASMY